MHGVEDTPGKKAYYIHLEAKPEHADKVEAFLRDINAGVNQEPGTGPWFGTRFSPTTFAIFEAFPDAAARHAHDAGTSPNLYCAFHIPYHGSGLHPCCVCLYHC